MKGNGIAILPAQAPARKILLTSASSHEPIGSVREGSDGDLLEAMLEFYATIKPEPILDTTYNAGRFWKGSKRHVVSMVSTKWKEAHYARKRHCFRIVCRNGGDCEG